MRDDVGKARETCYDLPGEGFSFGRPDIPNFEGAREVTMNWVSHTPAPHRQDSMPDFKLLNKKAISHGVTTAAEHQKFRTEQDFTPRTPQIKKTVNPKVIPSDVLPAFTYGKKIRPSTPIQHVVEYKFAEAQEQKLEQFYSARDAKEAEERQVRRIPLTNACRGHANPAKANVIQQTEESKEPFKLKKFQNVRSRVDFPGSPRNRANVERNRLAALEAETAAELASPR